LLQRFHAQCLYLGLHHPLEASTLGLLGHVSRRAIQKSTVTSQACPSLHNTNTLALTVVPFFLTCYVIFLDMETSLRAQTHHVPHRTRERMESKACWEVYDHHRCRGLVEGPVILHIPIRYLLLSKFAF